MSLLDVQHIKRSTKPVFKERRLKALKDIHLLLEKASTLPSWGNLYPKSILLNIRSHAGPADGRAGFTQWHRYLKFIKNKDASISVENEF